MYYNILLFRISGCKGSKLIPKSKMIFAFYLSITAFFTIYIFLQMKLY